jgi:hypothetical protein
VNIRLDRSLRKRLELCPVPFAEERAAELKSESPVLKFDLRVGPAERTGKSVVTYCPGGSRFFGVCSCGLDLKPREIVVETMDILPFLVDLLVTRKFLAPLRVFAICSIHIVWEIAKAD